MTTYFQIDRQVHRLTNVYTYIIFNFNTFVMPLYQNVNRQTPAKLEILKAEHKALPIITPHPKLYYNGLPQGSIASDLIGLGDFNFSRHWVETCFQVYYLLRIKFNISAHQRHSHGLSGPT